MKNLKGVMYAFIILVVGAFILGGCATPQKKLIPPPGPDPVPPDKVPRMYVKPTPQKVPRLSVDVASDVSKIAGTVTGVRKVYTVVIGNAAIIGVDTDTAWPEGIDLIEKTVAQKAEQDPRIVKAHVTGNENDVQTLREIEAKVKDGKPVTDYLDRINSIMKRSSS